MRLRGGGSGPGSSPPPCSRTMSQPGDGPWFVPASSYVSSERPQTTLCRDAVLAWPSSSRLPVEPTAPAATPAWARWSGGDGDRAPIERRPPLRVWERRIAGHARGAPPRIESSKDSDFLIGGASYRADHEALDGRRRRGARNPAQPCPVGFRGSISEVPSLMRCRQYDGAASISERKRLAID